MVKFFVFKISLMAALQVGFLAILFYYSKLDISPFLNLFPIEVWALLAAIYLIMDYFCTKNENNAFNRGIK